MAVAIITTDFPQGFGPDMYDRVSAELDLSVPLEGLISHWVGYVGDKWTVTDLWESREVYDRFQAERLRPAISKVSGMDPSSGPQPTITEAQVHHYLAP